MKYIDADKLKAEIENIKSTLCICDNDYQMAIDGWQMEAYNKVITILDTLSKQQEVDLERESPKKLDEMIDDHFKSLFPNIAYYRWRVGDVYVHASPDGIRNLCNHFYELGKNSK